MKRWILAATFGLWCGSAAAQLHHYEKGVVFPRPTPKQYDSLTEAGALPIWLGDERYRPFYWPRISSMLIGRVCERVYTTPSLDGGGGGELELAIPLRQADYGIYLYARANEFKLNDGGAIGWEGRPGKSGVMLNAGLGAGLSIPFRSPRLSLPVTLALGAATFRQDDRRISGEYLTIGAGVGPRYRLGQKFALQGMIQPTWFVPLRKRNDGIFSWNFSFGLEMALSVDRHLPLPLWIPPLVVGAPDVVQLLMAEPATPLNWLDRNIDIINTELKPLTAYRWYDLGYRGIVRGTVIASSRASTGNITALDIRIDSADRRGFRVWRTALLLDSTKGLKYLLSKKGRGAPSSTLEQIVQERIRTGEYAYRPKEALGTRYLRAELFPESKGPLDKIPKVGSRVEIAGAIMWDGDGHMEIHPRRPGDVRIIEGEFLDSDDEASLE